MLGGFNFPKRPALGNIASLGSFYDARTDTFTPISLLRTAPPAAAVTTTDIHKSDVRFSRTDTYTEKFKSMGVNAELSASVLAGLVNVEGSGRYLLDKRESNLSIQASLHYNITTVQESLNFFANELRECLAFTQIDGNLATHVVAEITWGAQNIVTLKRTVTQQEDRNEVEGQFTAAFDKLRIIKLEGAAELENESLEEEFTSAVEVTVYGDVLADDGLCPIDLHSALRFLRNVPTYVATANNGKGKPLVYTLLPLPLLKMFYNIEITAEITLTQLSAECLEEFVQLFDEFRNAQETLNGYCSYAKAHGFCVPDDHIRGVDDQLRKMRTTEASVKTRYAEALKSVRAGKADAQQLWALIKEIRENDLPDFCLPDTVSCVEKVEFIELLVSKGAAYVGFDGGSLDLELAMNQNIDIYAFYFNENTRASSDTWADNLALILQLLDDKKRYVHVVLVDCDATDVILERPVVHLWRQGRVITTDVAQEWGVLANLNTMRYPEDSLDRSEWGKPVKCAPVKIPCPGLDCVSTTKRSWICVKCRTPVMFSYVNKHLYCLCGRCEYHKWEFRCEDPRHGVDYQKYDDRKLLQFLENLEPFDELNILILGQTGVGKSTWINAFVNYLTFPTLDEAIKAEKLESVIPCSFSIQKEVSGRLVSVDIQVGFSAQAGENSQGISAPQAEADGSRGQSATRSTQVYAMLIGNRIVRVIDTPGIGDTRGVQQDKKNMADILKVLPTYENLHGILILLKSNEARLDVMFSFCIKELLIHLHRNAVRNIVFGFTNTRGTSYHPGDTFKPLESLLSKYKAEVDIALSRENVYCFDSESFRYLAALKQGEDLKYKKENSESWDYSVGECKRLVQHLQGRPPHKVTSTTNLNEVRRTILQLTEPMAKLAQDIQDTIVANASDIQDLETKKMEKGELEHKLNVQQKVPVGRDVDKPRTVCADRDCIEYRSEGLYNRRDQTTIYKTVCHDPCYLTTVDVGIIGHRGLQSCTAMGRSDVCQKCGHHWMKHLHVMYVIESEWVTVKDQKVQDDLGKNTSAIDKIGTAISEKKSLISGLEDEQKRVKEAAATFSLFLQDNCIAAYNDETVEYLEKLIDLEKSKKRGGAVRNRVADLEKYLAEYLEEKDILDEALKQNGDKRGDALSQDVVLALIQELYRLPRYGKYLEQTHRTIGRAHEVAYREKPLRVRAGAHWHGEAGFGMQPEHAPTSPTSYFSRMTQSVAAAASRLVGQGGGWRWS